MPVLTRSQTKALQKSLQYMGHSTTTISSSITSSAELLDVYATTTNELILNKSTLDTLPHKLSSTSLATLSSSSLSLEFENNLGILKC
jgi:hypothetical protein